MNVYYTNPFFDKLPNELKNHICSFLTTHPLKTIINEIGENVNYYGELFHKEFLHMDTFIQQLFLFNGDLCDICNDFKLYRLKPNKLCKDCFKTNPKYICQNQFNKDIKKNSYFG
jgi:hypothetical protein